MRLSLLGRGLSHARPAPAPVLIGRRAFAMPGPLSDVVSPLAADTSSKPDPAPAGHQLGSAASTSSVTASSTSAAEPAAASPAPSAGEAFSSSSDRPLATSGSAPDASTSEAPRPRPSTSFSPTTLPSSSALSSASPEPSSTSPSGTAPQHPPAPSPAPPASASQSPASSPAAPVVPPVLRPRPLASAQSAKPVVGPPKAPRTSKKSKLTNAPRTVQEPKSIKTARTAQISFPKRAGDVPPPPSTSDGGAARTDPSLVTASPGRSLSSVWPSPPSSAGSSSWSSLPPPPQEATLPERKGVKRSAYNAAYRHMTNGTGVRVFSLPAKCTEAELRAALEDQVGHVVSCAITPGTDAALVHFATVQKAKTAIRREVVVLRQGRATLSAVRAQIVQTSPIQPPPRLPSTLPHPLASAAAVGSTAAAVVAPVAGDAVAASPPTTPRPKHFLRSSSPTEHLHKFAAAPFPPATSILTAEPFRRSIARFQPLYASQKWAERTFLEDGHERTYLVREIPQEEFTEGLFQPEEFACLGDWSPIVMGTLFLRWASAIQDLHQHHADIRSNRDMIRIRLISHTTYYPATPLGSLPDPARPPVAPQGLTTRDLHLAASLEKLVGAVKEMLGQEASSDQ